MTKLPDKPSALIRLAIADLEKCEVSPVYTVDMDQWHRPSPVTQKCRVCLAGAVIGQTLDNPIDQWILPSETDFKDQLHALDGFRVGSWEYGCSCLGVKRPEALEGLYPSDYHRQPAAFKADMLRAADIFEEAGL